MAVKCENPDYEKCSICTGIDNCNDDVPGIANRKMPFPTILIVYHFFYIAFLLQAKYN